jgi:uncharacterized protein YlxW (UPF0749 family)
VIEQHSHRDPDEPRPPWHQRIVEAFRTRYGAYGEHGIGWRLLTPAVFILAGALFVTSAVNSGGTDLRPGRYDDLADLAADRSDRIADLERRSARLQEQIDDLTENLTDTELDEANTELDELRGPAGLEGVAGPGVTIALDDAPERILDDDTTDDLLKLVHEQDIQAVVNAMWAGGAEAITVQGKRITSTTGILCVGNSVLLQGVAYPPPYIISAIGNTARIMANIDRDPQILRYLRDAETYELGWDVDLSDRLEFPRYDGPIDTAFAQPLSN